VSTQSRPIWHGVFEPRNGENINPLVTCAVDDLRPLPSYARHQLSVQTTQITALERLRDPFLQPLLITRNRHIIDGYARWELAKRRGLATLRCLEYDLDDQAALESFIENHRPTATLGHFSRIELALDLEPLLRERAALNRQAGGRLKELSTLTEAEKVNSRSEVARVASASVGNVHKVKFILNNACQVLREAARAGEVSINLAEKWSRRSTHHQQELLRVFRIHKGIRRKARNLIAVEVAESGVNGAQRITLSKLIDWVNSLKATDPAAAHSVLSAEIQQIRRCGIAILAPEEVVNALWELP